MARYPVHNVVDEKSSGYIKQKTLENFLLEKYKVSTIEDFDIRFTRQKWDFWTPEPAVSEDEIRILREKEQKG